MRNMKARQEARDTGARYYSTGIPCKNGHDAPRATISGACTICTALATKAWAVQRPERMAAYTAAYRVRNPELSRARDNTSKKSKRKENPEKYQAPRAAQTATGAWRGGYVQSGDRPTHRGRDDLPDGVPQNL